MSILASLPFIWPTARAVLGHHCSLWSPSGSRGTSPAPRYVRPKGGTASSPRHETRRVPRRNGARLPPTGLRSSWSEERLGVGLIAFRLFTHLQSMRRSKEKGASNGLRATDPRDAGPGQDPQPVGSGALADCDPWDLPPRVVVSDQPRAAGLWARQGL